MKCNCGRYASCQCQSCAGCCECFLRNPGETSPKYGDRVLICVHKARRLRENKPFGHVHWYTIDPPIKMGRPDGTSVEANWGGLCSRCFRKVGDNFLQAQIGGDIVWGRDLGGDPATNPTDDYRQNIGPVKRRHSTVPPEDAASQIVTHLEKNYGMVDLEIIQQEPYLAAGREHCSHAAFTIISDMGGLVEVSLEDKFIGFLKRLGYWCEPWDEIELCFMPTDQTLETQYHERAKQARQAIKLDPACQRDLERAIEILEALPVVGFEEGGMHQFTWIRMKKPIKIEGRGNDRTSLEAIIHSEPHRISDLDSAFAEIRKLKCVSNIWYNLD